MFSFQPLRQDPIAMRLLFSLIILLIIFFARRILSQWIIKGLSHIHFHKIKLEAVAFNCLQKPINYLLLITGLYLACAVSPFVYYTNSTEQIVILGEFSLKLSLIPLEVVNTLYLAFLAGILTWIIYDVEHIYEQFFTELNEKLSLIDNTIFIRYLSRIINFVTLTIGGAIVLTILVPNLSNILTGVGIGGVAVAFVSKDSLASIFSGILLLLDKPFVIGDWVTVADAEGIVEDISFRSTRIRTFSQGLMIIPNNTVGNANIINWSRMEKRRVSFDLGVSYDTPLDQLQDCEASIRQLLADIEDVEPNTSVVYFNCFGDYSLKIKIAYYTYLLQFTDFLALQEKVNLGIMAICEQNHVDITIPTQKIILPKEKK